MSIEKELTKVLSIGAGLFLVTSLFSGCDESYDLNKLEGDVSLFENGIQAPIGDTEKYYLSQLIPESEFLKVEDGRYVIEYSGEANTALDIPGFQVPRIDPGLSTITLDFFESVPAEIKEILNMVGYDHGDPIPDVSQYGISLVVPDIHTTIPEDQQSFEFEITGIPEQLVNIKTIDADESAIVTLSLHAEGFPTTLDSIEFQFLLNPPVELHIEPVDKSVYYDESDHFYHIEHSLPVKNGVLDDQVKFRLNELYFDPALERTESGTLDILALLGYKGRIDIPHSFDLSGWVPILYLNIGFSIEQCEVEMAEGCVQATVEPLSIVQKLEGLPDMLTDTTTCIDLEDLTIELNINNTTPASLQADLELESIFYDGTSSGIVKTLEPIVIEANKYQSIHISNEEEYAAEPGYMPTLNELMYKIPETLSLSAKPYIPPTDIRVELGRKYDIGIDYSLNVPVAFGEDFRLKFSGDFGNLATDLSQITEMVTAVSLSADIISTLPLEVKMYVTPVDKDGNELKGVTLEGVPLTLEDNSTTPLRIKIVAEAENELHKLYTLRYELDGRAGTSNNDLRPDQYLQIKNVVLGLPKGATLSME